LGTQSRVFLVNEMAEQGSNLRTRAQKRESHNLQWHACDGMLAHGYFVYDTQMQQDSI